MVDITTTAFRKTDLPKSPLDLHAFPPFLSLIDSSSWPDPAETFLAMNDAVECSKKLTTAVALRKGHGIMQERGGGGARRRDGVIEAKPMECGILCRFRLLEDVPIDAGSLFSAHLSPATKSGEDRRTPNEKSSPLGTALLATEKERDRGLCCPAPSWN